MDKRFFNMFNLTEAEAIVLLDTPQDQIIEEQDSRYIAASHLVNFPSEASIAALIRAVQTTDDSLNNRIARRKSAETLGRLEAVQALPILRNCLRDADNYMVENAVWSIAEIGTTDPEILEEMAKVLERPGQSYRVVIHALNKLNYKPAVDRIRPFTENSDPTIMSAAITAVCRLSENYESMDKVVELLQHSNVFARRLCIQDLMDVQYFDAIPDVTRAPVSLVFRLRGIRSLAEAGIKAGKLTFKDIQPALEQSLRDHPKDLDLIHQYDQLPTIEFLMRELYETDFGRCYLATQTILEHYPEQAPAALFATFAEEANNDYGAHFHVVKIFGWLKHAPAYDLIVEALQNTAPQFQKSRAAAAIALGELGDRRAIPLLQASLSNPIWDLRYASMLALEQLGEMNVGAALLEDKDWCVRDRASQAQLMTV